MVTRSVARSPAARRSAWALLLSSLACAHTEREAAPPAEEPARPCAFDTDCREDERCADGSVGELAFESSDRPTCHARGEVVGGRAATWAWAPGGRALGERLCTAQGIRPGVGAEADAGRERDAALLAAAGTRVIRVDFPWSRVEPARGELHLEEFDPMVDAARDSGLEVIGILAYGVPWATSATDTDDRFPPDDPADYAAYARAVVEHYAGRVTRWELWNEPNGGYRFFRPNLNGDAARYGALLAAGARAVREACPACEVISGGLFFHEQVVNGAVEFTEDLLDATPGAFVDVDAFGFHPYPRYPPAAAPEDDGPDERALGGMVADLAEVLALRGAPALPLAATELGWPAYGGVDELTQAAFLAREVLLGASMGVDPLCWFNVTDGPRHGTFPPEDDFGLYRFGSDVPGQPIDPKPARDALAWLARIGAGAVPAGPVRDPALHAPEAGRFGLEFDAPGGRWTALWRSDGSTEAVELTGEARRALDLRGEVVAEPAGGALRVELGASPVYLIP